MIVGVVTADGREATIRLMVRGPDGRERVVRAVVDTGFTGTLMLPPALVEELELVRHGVQRATLADGSAVYLDIHEAAIVWDDQLRDVRVLAAGGDPLVGMALLRGYELTMEVVDGGVVRIAARDTA